MNEHVIISFNQTRHPRVKETQVCSKEYYPASDRNLEIWLAETNTTCRDIMLPY